MATEGPDRTGDQAATPPSSTTPETAPSERERTTTAPERRVPLTQQLGRVVALVVAVLFGIFAVSNAQYVDFNWVFGGTEVEVTEATGQRVGGGVRLIVLMVASFVAGVVVTGLVAWRRGRRRQHDRLPD